MNVTNFFYQKEKHKFHLVENSVLPIITAFSAFICVINVVYYLNWIPCISTFEMFIFRIGILMFTIVLFSWFIQVVYEAGLGHHTQIVSQGLRLGMILFIVSETMLFFSFFWAYFHLSLSPSIDIGCVWPPKGFQELDIWGLPLMNTILLLSSGFTLTFAHSALLKANNFHYVQLTRIHLLVTIILGLTFLYCQFIEYKYGLNFSWTDSVFGSTFFITTGFHGFHVTIGVLFLIFCLIWSIFTTIPDTYIKTKKESSFARDLSCFAFNPKQHVGFESAAWYWHFVDVVWIFLFITIYWWSTK